MKREKIRLIILARRIIDIVIYGRIMQTSWATKVGINILLWKCVAHTRQGGGGLLHISL